MAPAALCSEPTTPVVCVLADDDGYEFLKTINDVLSVLFRRLERGQQTHLLLPNPDLVYPREAGGVGAAAGSVAALIETALTLRDPSRSHCFVPLGKPHAPLFEAAMEKLGLVDKRRVVMVGDQLSTDIRGAAAFAIDSILVLSGIGRRQDLETSDVQPTHVITSVDVLLYFVTYFKKWFQLDRRRALN